MERSHVVVNEEDDVMMLPPGFRFHPTDEEIITHYLREKVMNGRFIARAIGEVDLNKCEPWDLPKRAKLGEKEWFFFCQRDKKYPTGMRTNRATESGYWKATGKDKEIYKGKGKGNLIGMKKTLVFYKGRAPKGEKTNWVMHEYRLEGKFSYCNFPKSSRNDWVVCRIVHKNTTLRKIQVTNLARKDSFMDNLFDSPSLPELMDLSNPSKDTHEYSTFTNEKQEFIPPASIKPSYENFSFNNFSMNNPNIYHQASTSNSTPHSNFYPQISHQNSNFNQINSPSIQNNQYYCKVEQFSSNNSMVTVSQDTGVSTDVGPEISSVISKQESNGDKSFEDLLNCFLK